MTDRITNRQLEVLVNRINEITGNSPHCYIRDANGKLTAQIGNYHISGAYGGVCLHQMVNESGGVRSVFGLGHVPKRELYNQMQAFLVGLEQRK